MIAMQEWGTEFNSQNLCDKSSDKLVTLVLEEEEGGQSLGIFYQPA